MVNRAAVIIKCKEPFVKWVNAVEPNKSTPEVTLEELNKDRNVYLVAEHEGENIEKWISKNFKVLFENELEDWYLDESLWPKKRTRKVFDEWFDIECFSVIIDTVGGKIFDDGM